MKKLLAAVFVAVATVPSLFVGAAQPAAVAARGAAFDVGGRA